MHLARIRRSGRPAGWNIGVGEPVSLQEAQTYYQSRTAQLNATATLSLNSVTGAADSAFETAPEIIALARSLQNDPKLIYEFVHNHIDYVPYYGYLKGPILTLLDRSGNDFDQASLMVALLRASNYQAQYVFGDMAIPNFGAENEKNMQSWLGIDADINIIGHVLVGGGIPFEHAGTATTMSRVWVKANIEGAEYFFDPALKAYRTIAGIDLKKAMGYSVLLCLMQPVESSVLIPSKILKRKGI